MKDKAIIHFVDPIDEIPDSRLTYKLLRASVLQSGGFSAFSATETQKRARMFDKLGKDPTIEYDKEHSRFPWTVVRLKEQPW